MKYITYCARKVCNMSSPVEQPHTLVGDIYLTSHYVDCMSRLKNYVLQKIIFITGMKNKIIYTWCLCKLNHYNIGILQAVKTNVHQNSLDF